MRSLVSCTVVSLFLLINSFTAYSTTIETVSSWHGGGIANFGEDNSGSLTDSGVYATYGQIFRLASVDDNVLQSITFYVNDYSLPDTPDTIDFALYLYQWNGSRIIGNALFESQALSTIQAYGYEEFNVYTGGVQLSVNTDYVFFMSASNFFDGIEGYGQVGYTSNPYPDGKCVFMNNKNDFTKLTTNSWRSIDALDLAFKLELTPTVAPEPISSILFITGGALLAGRSQIKRRMNA